MRVIVMVFLGLLTITLAFAEQCPDPQQSSLAWGEVPPHWEVSPFSAGCPQADEQTDFTKAHILQAGYGQGVSCHYRNRVGDYAIWRQARTKLPARQTPFWVATLGGYVCDAGLAECDFLLIG
ncbi:MAG: DUF3757 domain-containing protein [Legionellaceae bacterium]|nr:DUF3757 domain-containing protein [Legionellaceae bacterium]